MSMDVWKHFWEILINFYARSPFVSKTSYSGQFLSSLGERGYIFWLKFQNLCQNDKNEKLYFAFNSVREGSQKNYESLDICPNWVYPTYLEP